MHRIAWLALSVALVVLTMTPDDAAAQGLAPPSSPPSSPAFVDLVARSGFIFQGTVKKLAASTPTVPTAPNTMIVHVDHVIETSPPADNPRGRDVTVRVEDPSKFKLGLRANFFTFVYSAGTTLGLDAVGTTPIQSPKVVEQQVKDARRILADRALAARLASAQTVVVGVIGAAPSAPAPPARGEHDPFWQLRAIAVQSVEKGGGGGGPGAPGFHAPPVNVNVAASRDVFWSNTPKPGTGANGIFLLQPSPGPDHWSGVAGLFLVDPLDFLPLSELDRVRRLLRSSP